MQNAALMLHQFCFAEVFPNRSDIKLSAKAKDVTNVS
jgi:hypothetical protein